MDQHKTVAVDQHKAMSLADQACSDGLAALRDGDLDLAEAHFQEALQKKFDHPKTRYAVCSCAVSTVQG